MSTNVYILLDRSGSMSSKWSDTIGTINGYVRALADAGHDGTVTVLSFSSGGSFNSFQRARLLGVPAPAPQHEAGAQALTGSAEMLAHGVAVRPAEWVPLGTEVLAMGGTPLFDAISHIVAVTQQDRNPTGVLVIMTDGEENTSTVCNKDSARLLLDGVRARGWKVDQLGVEFDNYRQAAAVGTSVRNTVSMSRGAMRSGAVSDSMAANTMSYVASGVDTGYGDDFKGLMGDPTVQAAVGKTVAAVGEVAKKALKRAAEKVKKEG